ncbi:ribosomal protein L22/L17 [Chaetomidium leptoderma]|uniref:Ribosomal protein L22/L17 n=1 Tax=Chaetomidium leptoderma TaxID=669021 RepID=A0AAN6VHP3_9PEZI|nr:ribosomal protein L22/L17 [Chaetomidium leptoderma]
MSLNVPSRRLLRGAPALATATPTTTASLLPALQALTLSPNTPSTRPIHTTPSNQWFWNRNKKTDGQASLDQQLAGNQETRKSLVKSLTSRIEGPAIFEDEVRKTAPRTDQEGKHGSQQPADPRSLRGVSMARAHLARAADPDPRSRVRWERKMVMRQVQRGTNPFSREPQAAVIARTERQLTSVSPFLPTSTKKLVMLARQIQGKTVSEALVQMRFSKKKMAQEVRYQLEIARDTAIVARGMGMGGASAAAAAKAKAEAGADGGEVRASSDGKTVEIQTKDGKWIKIDDPTRMYVAEAWVNRGKWRGKRPDYRARGRLNMKMKPKTSISIVLKEEKTRIRQAADREAKKLRQGPWVHLPNRPVTAQRQWYSW